MALVGINAYQNDPQKESGLDKVLKGVQIAQGVMGTALVIPKFLQDRQEFKLRQEEFSDQSGMRKAQTAKYYSEADKNKQDMQPLSPEQSSYLQGQGIDKAAMPRNQSEFRDLASRLTETMAQKNERQNREVMLGLSVQNARRADRTEARAVDNDGYKREKEEQDRKEKEKQSFNERYIPNVGVTYTAQDAKDLKDALEAKKSLDESLDEMLTLRKKYGAEFTNREAVERGKQLSSTVLLKMKSLEKLGVLSKSDEDIINSIIPKDPLAVKMTFQGGDPIISNLEKFKADKASEFQTRLGTRIQQPVKEINGVRFKKVQGGWEPVD
jgi:hypothetical protein